MNRRVRDAFDRFLAAMNRHDAAGAVEWLAEDVVFWEPSYDEPRRGREAVRRDFDGFFAMLPDVRFVPEALIVEDDRVVTEWTYRATFNGRPVELRECSIGRLDTDERLAEVRVYFDRLGLLRQLGLSSAG
jgi:steroid delta-isomerase-like uncharacterized protein